MRQAFVAEMTQIDSFKAIIVAKTTSIRDYFFV